MASTRGERLRSVRRAHFSTANAAAKALRIAASTYNAHERAKSPTGRDFGPDEAKCYARLFGTTPEWLLTGYGEPRYPRPSSADRTRKRAHPKIPVVGYVGAGSEAHFYAVSEGELDEVDGSNVITKFTVAVEIRGESSGSLFNRWLVFYDDVRRPVTADLYGKLCVVGLEDGRILVKQIQPSRDNGCFDLVSATEPTMRSIVLEWAATVKNMMPR